MTTRPTQSLDERLMAADLAINNALNTPDILAAVSQYGYNEARLKSGLALYRAARELVAGQQRAYGEQYAATQVFKTAREKAEQSYMCSLKMARIAFKGKRSAHTALMMRGRRRRVLAGWLEQSTVFYKNLLAAPELMAGLAQFGYTEAKLQAELELVKAVTETNHAQEVAKGEAVAATHARDDKLAELERWLSEFKAIARIALAGSQMQEALGLGPVA